MANPVLFASSLSITIVHLIAQFWYQQTNPILSTMMICGLVTSIWNHGVTSFIAKYTDRCMMWIGFFVDSYLTWQIRDQSHFYVCIVCLILSASLYWVAKAWVTLSRNGNVPHLMAHCMLTVTHVSLIAAFA